MIDGIRFWNYVLCFFEVFKRFRVTLSIFISMLNKVLLGLTSGSIIKSGSSSSSLEDSDGKNNGGLQ